MKKFRTVQYNALRSAEKHSIGVIPAEAGIPLQIVLNHDFNKICKMNRISPLRTLRPLCEPCGYYFLTQRTQRFTQRTQNNRANPDNLVKIVVQDKSGKTIIHNHKNQINQSSDKNAIKLPPFSIQRKKSNQLRGIN